MSPYHGHLYPPPATDSNTVTKSIATAVTIGAAAATAAQLHKPVTERHNVLGEIIQAGAVTGLAAGAANLIQNSLGCDKKTTAFAAIFITSTALIYALKSPES